MGGTPDITVGEAGGTPDSSISDQEILTQGEGDRLYVARSLFDAMLPWRHDLNPTFPHANTNWSTVSVGANILTGGYIQSSGAQNAELGWDVILGAGTWDFLLLHVRDVNRGIYSVQLDGVEVGTIDGYNASTANNTLSTVTGIVVPTTARKRVKLKMATKNASSSSFFGTAQAVGMRRTS